MNTPGIQLSDLFYGLQLRIKVMEELIQSTKQGMRPENDFQSRFFTQAWVLANELKKIKPLVDAMLLEGNGIVSTVGSDTEKQVFTLKC